MKPQMNLIGLVALFVFAGIVFFTFGSVASVVSVGGTLYDCDRFYDGYAVPSNDIATACAEDDGYVCTVYARQGSFGTIHSVECTMKKCYQCTSNAVQLSTLSNIKGEDTCTANTYDGSVKLGEFKASNGLDVYNVRDGVYTDSIYKDLCNVLDPVECYRCEGSTITATYEASGVCASGWTTDFSSLDCQEATNPNDNTGDTTTPTTNPVTCYTCGASGVESKVFDNSCGIGYQTSVPQCDIDVTCYTCTDGTVTSKDFVNTCGDGYTLEQPTCEIGTTCYSCDGSNSISQEFIGSCPIGWEEEMVSCTPDTVTTTCYQCDRTLGVVNSIDSYSGSCTTGWSTEQPATCEAYNNKNELAFDNLINFKDKPVQSVLLIISGIIILVSLFSLLYTLFNK